MVFVHDTEVSLATAVDLINSAEPGSEEVSILLTVRDLDRFVRRWEVTGVRRRTRAELAELHDLRDRLRSIWGLDKDALVVEVNRLLAEGNALPQLVKHDHWDYHIHASSPHEPLAKRLGVEIALALVDVIRADEVDRLRGCAAAECTQVLIDLSKNRSKRFCGVTCGNRENVAAYRARRRSPSG